MSNFIPDFGLRNVGLTIPKALQKIYGSIYMMTLAKINDPLLAQIACDALASQGIKFHIEHAGMSALLPLPTVIEARIMVNMQDEEAALQVMKDLEIATNL
ncbi:MAG: DUF2007 domain-containing protein [Mariprofundaceae bacterium]